MAVIILLESQELVCEIAAKQGLFPYKITHVYGTSTSKAKRVLIQIAQRKQALITAKLVLEVARHQYTAAYKKLIKDFYLKL